MTTKKALKLIVAVALLLTVLVPASFSSQAQDNDTVTLTFAAFAVPREAYGEIIAAFQEYWKEETGQTVVIQESYQASGAQSRAIVGGFKADVAALSLESDITRIVDAGLITHDWKAEYNGVASTSIVILAVRSGNPRDIEDWADLAQDDLEVITPDPSTSGGAQWNILAAYGAAWRGYVDGYEDTEESATEFLAEVIDNVTVLDRDGRESFLTFESGIGDVAISYENEYYAGIEAGGEYDIVYPSSTILIENPIAVIDTYVDENGTREVAEAFVQFVWGEEAQQIFLAHGFRPVNETVAAQIEEDEELAEKFPPVEDVFTSEEFGGWDVIRTELFGDEGRFTQLIAEVKGE